MIDVTERQIAEQKINTIKSEIALSGVDYYICETPYTLGIQIKKKFIKDNSPKSQVQKTLAPTHLSQNNTSLSSSSYFTASSPLLQRSSPSSSQKQNDSGVVTESSLFEIEPKRNESKISKLEDIIASKDSLIKQLEQKLKTSEEDNSKIKIEIKSKNEQLKAKNKLVEKSMKDLENEKEERTTNHVNYSSKISNLENKVNHMNKSLEEKNQIIKDEKKKLKNVLTKKKSKDQSTETDNLVSSTTSKSSSTQTETAKKTNAGTSPIFSKLYIEGEPTHDITCVCLCHDGSEGKCEVQLFKHTSDPEVALDSLYYREEYDEWTDDDIYGEPSEELVASRNAVENVMNLKSKMSDDDYMKEMIKSALDSWIQEKSLKDEDNDADTDKHE